ncbi:MAG: DNA-binding response regulator [Treponema sp. CETP13]|nr:MAG: DNA-binding response regulator [Treponema sp. CETP13]
MKTILVVDDELPIRELITYNLEKEGFTVFAAENGTTALELSREKKPDLMILDLMLPDMSGLDICRIIKHDEQTSHIPIIMVTAKTEDSDIVTGLELGADDYVTKPFSPRVLIARVQSVLRRKTHVIEGSSASSGVLEPSTKENQLNMPTKKTFVSIKLHNVKIIPEKFEVFVDDEQIVFSATEFAILQFLVSHPGQVFTRQKIINEVKGDSYPVTDRAIDVQILSIRKKLGERCKIIETIRGIGYRVIEE